MRRLSLLVTAASSTRASKNDAQQEAQQEKPGTPSGPLRRQLSSARLVKQQDDARIQGLQAELTASRARCADLDTQVLQASLRADGLETELEQFRARFSWASRQLKEERVLHADTIRSKMDELLNLQKSVDSSRSKTDRERAAFTARIETMQTEIHALEATVQQHAAADAEVSQSLQSRADHAERECKELRERLKQVVEERAALTSTVEKLGTKVRRLGMKLERSKEASRQAATELHNSFLESLDSLGAQCRAVEEENKALRAHIAGDPAAANTAAAAAAAAAAPTPAPAAPAADAQEDQGEATELAAALRESRGVVAALKEQVDKQSAALELAETAMREERERLEMEFDRRLQTEMRAYQVREGKSVTNLAHALQQTRMDHKHEASRASKLEDKLRASTARQAQLQTLVQQLRSTVAELAAALRSSEKSTSDEVTKVRTTRARQLDVALKEASQARHKAREMQVELVDARRRLKLAEQRLQSSSGVRARRARHGGSPPPPAAPASPEDPTPATPAEEQRLRLELQDFHSRLMQALDVIWICVGREEVSSALSDQRVQQTLQHFRNVQDAARSRQQELPSVLARLASSRARCRHLHGLILAESSDLDRAMDVVKFCLGTALAEAKPTD